MKNHRGQIAGGVEDPIAPQPGPSSGRQKPTSSSKRKGSDEEDTSLNNNKRKKLIATSDKSKTIKGGRKAGGLVIQPLSSSSGSSVIPAIHPRPPSRGSSQPSKRAPDKFNITILDQSGNVSTTVANKGKGKEREDVPSTQQDLEVEEDIRQMDAERERLRVREERAQSQATHFKQPLLLPPSSTSRQKSVLSPGSKLSTPGVAKIIDITQPLPIRDTPTIDRNRVMREEPAQRRRSSLSRRGKRASSSFENTGVIPQPHASVSTLNFHKHIDPDLPEAHRARHLLVWCASRASTRPSQNTVSRTSGGPLPPLTAEGVRMLQDVQKEVQKMLTEQQIDTSFSSRMDDDSDKPRIKPHEQNIKNLKREDDFMRHIERCKREGEAWSSMIQSYNARQATTMDALTRQRQSNGNILEWLPPDSSDPLYERELYGAQLARRCIESVNRKRGGNPLSQRMSEVESKVDRVHSALNIAEQLTKRTTRHLDKRFKTLATALAARSQPTSQPSDVSILSTLVSANPNPPSATGLGAPPDTLSILRALTRTDMEHPRKDTGDAVRKAAREVQRVNATPGRTSAGASVGGERRLTAVTPRHAPGTPRRLGTPRQKSEGVDNGG